MALSRLLLGWAAVLALLLVWHAAERRVRRIPGDLGPALRAGLPALLSESLLLTLFAGLWFGSLGSGGAALLFLVVGLLVEIPSRLRSHSFGELPWALIAANVARMVLAGILFQVILG